MIAIVEMPQGTTHKYEQDKVDGLLTLDRVLNQPIPYNYGYIPGTLCGDGDPLDVFVLGNIPIYPLTKVKITPVAVLKCIDNGHSDDKLIAIIESSNWPNSVGIDIVRTYLTSYKKGFEILEVGDKNTALDVYKNSVDMYNKSHE